MALPKKGTPKYDAWILTPEYTKFCATRCGGHPKKGTPEYGVWILTQEYKEFCRKTSDSKKGDKHPRFGKPAWNKGKKGLSGKDHPMFGITGDKNPNFGHRHTEESIRLMSEAKQGINNPFFGKKRPDMSERLRGENNHNWRGGSSFEPYSPKFDKLFKQQTRILYGNVCLFPGCGITPEETGQELDLHHIDYDKNSLNCVPLCRNHNSVVNSNRDEWEEYFTWIVRMYLEWHGRGNWV